MIAARRRVAVVFASGLALACVLQAARAAIPTPNEPSAEAAAVRAALEREDWRAALDIAEAALAHTPHDLDLRTAFGEALWRAGEPERAEEVFEGLVVGADAPPVRALVGLGLVRAARARFEDAVDLMARAVRAAPESPHVRYWAAGYQSDRAAAVEAMERYLAVAADEDPDRVEAVRGTLRLYRALGEREVWIPEERPTPVEVPLDRLRGIDGRVTGWGVDVVLGERKRPLRVLFDTGSPGLYLSAKAASKRGFVPLSEETTFGGGGTGRHRSGRGLLSRFELGDVRFSSVLVSTTVDAIDDLGRYKGLLGVHAFDGYRVVIDLARGRLTLEQPPPEPEPGGAPYWTVSGQILVRAESVGGPSGMFLLDTGATRTLLDREFAERIEVADLGRKARVRGYGGLLEDARVVDGAVVRFLDVETRGDRRNAVDLGWRSRLCGVQISGFLGLDVLGRNVVVLDTVHRRVWIRVPAEAR
jgi:Tfp pilus assembly protein PilF